MQLRPFWRFYGGKWRAAPRYPEPQHKMIVEPFAGAAGYATRYYQRDILLIDADPRIVAIWRWLISASPDDVLSIGDIPHGGTIYDLDAPVPARHLAGFWCNSGSATPKLRPSRWAQEHAHGSRRQHAGWTSSVRQRIAAQVPYIKHWSAVEGDYTVAPDVTATWFIDPPYQTYAGRSYARNSVDYKALGAWCDARFGQIIACDQAGAEWRSWNGGFIAKSLQTKRHQEVYWHKEHNLPFRDCAHGAENGRGKLTV